MSSEIGRRPSIDEAMRAAIAARLIEEFGDPKAAADAVWTLARENEWFREAAGAERYLLRAPSIAATRNEAILERIVAWHGTPIGTLVHDGVEWRWRPAAVAGPQVVLEVAEPGEERFRSVRMAPVYDADAHRLLRVALPGFQIPRRLAPHEHAESKKAGRRATASTVRRRRKAGSQSGT